jgi:hypothetical protein
LEASGENEIDGRMADHEKKYGVARSRSKYVPNKKNPDRRKKRAADFAVMRLQEDQ